MCSGGVYILGKGIRCMKDQPWIPCVPTRSWYTLDGFLEQPGCVFPRKNLWVCTKNSLWTKSTKLNYVSYSPGLFPIMKEIALLWHDFFTNLGQLLFPQTFSPSAMAWENFRKQSPSQPSHSLQHNQFHTCLPSLLMGQLHLLKVSALGWPGALTARLPTEGGDECAMSCQDCVNQL